MYFKAKRGNWGLCREKGVKTLPWKKSKGGEGDGSEDWLETKGGSDLACLFRPPRVRFTD